MRKRSIGIIITLILFTVSSSFAQQEEKSITLSLEDCIVKAMRNNLGVAIEVLNPDLSDLAVMQAKEMFLPALSLSFNTRDTNQASFSFLESSTQVSAQRNGWSAEISQLIPTGGNFSVSLDGYKNETNQSFQTINPRFGRTLTFSFSQPLLRNFGVKTTRREIIIARNNLDISETQLERSLQQTVFDVEQAYWALVGYTENLKVREQSLRLAQDLLEKNKRSVEIGTLAPIEILSAQSAVASRQADIIQAETQVKDSEDNLRILLNLAAEGIEEDLKITPTDTPDFTKHEVTFEEALRTAIENRPDLNGSRIDLKNREINLKYAKNQLLPALNLTASYWSPGISGTQIIFDPGNPFAPPIGEIEHGPNEALEDALGFTYDNWSVAFTLDIPLDSVFSRANYTQAKVNMEQSRLMLQDQEQQIYLEVKSAVRAVQSNYERVQAYKVARELAEETLKAEEEKLKVGISTPYFVLQYQTELTTAQTNELQAIIEYNISLATLDRALGTSLEKKNIRFTDYIGR